MDGVEMIFTNLQDIITAIRQLRNDYKVDQKKSVTTSDLPFLISEVLQNRELRVFEVKDYSVVSNRGLRPTATVLIRFRDKEFQATGSGDGGYDAFMQALKTMEKQLGFMGQWLPVAMYCVIICSTRQGLLFMLLHCHRIFIYKCKKHISCCRMQIEHC